APDKPKNSGAATAIDIAGEVVGAVFEETVLGMLGEFVGVFMMMYEVAAAWEEASEENIRAAFFDGASSGAVWGAVKIQMGKTRVDYSMIDKDIWSDAKGVGRLKPYYPAEDYEWKPAFSQGALQAVQVYNPAMVKTEQLTRKKLEEHGMSGAKLEATY